MDVRRHWNLKGIIENHTQFYYEVTRRKYKTLLSKLYEQREIKEGLIKACDMIDLIIEIIRGSKSQKEVKACLPKEMLEIFIFSLQIL